LQPGRYSVCLPAHDLTRGVYVLKLETGARVFTRKLVIE